MRWWGGRRVGGFYRRELIKSGGGHWDGSVAGVQDEVRKELEAWIRERKVSYGLSHYLEYTFGGGGRVDITCG
jgi:hypothetical protein